LKALIVSEYYPRRADPVLGIWAHRQALAAREAGAEVEVVVLHRPIPPSRSALNPAAWATAMRQPKHARIDGIDITYVRYPSPPRPRGYGNWGAWATPWLRRALRGRDFDLIHAHNAVPAGDAVVGAGATVPLIVSVHGGDVYFTAERWLAPVQRAFGSADLILANSAGTAQKVSELGHDARVLHLGTDIPKQSTRDQRPNTVVTVAHLVARKRHDDVVRAVAQLDGWRYLVIGDGPERAALEALARQTGADVEFTGQLPHEQALALARQCSVFAMPSTEEAFGVAYIEAMAGWLPAIGAAGEPGPAEIESVALVEPGDIGALVEAIEVAASDDGSWARSVAERFSWKACGEATVAAYEDVLSEF
jgi:teichuronic acid biosynthesis glycosyltransferase TuaC